MILVDKIRFFANRLKERLWVKPFITCVVSLFAVSLAKLTELSGFEWRIPYITTDAIEALLQIMGSSMLVIATFAVASMVSAYASASSSATPRSFRLIVSDDLSQNALSTFIGAFIFSIVALTSAKSDFFQATGMSVLFLMTVIVFAIVVMTFVRWVDQIARLGRLDASIEKVEHATQAAIREWRKAPNRCAQQAKDEKPAGKPVYAQDIGYVQHIDVHAMQEWAVANKKKVTIAALPGAFTAPGRPIAFIQVDAQDKTGSDDIDEKKLINAFVIGRDRVFDEDPRFGFVVLSEIADRALSPGVNDPGSAIAVLGCMVRLFALWSQPIEATPEVKYDRVYIPQLSLYDMVDDAFTAVSRDGAGILEVMLRLQKALESLTLLDSSDMRDAAIAQSRLSLARAELKLDLPQEVALVRKAAAFSRQP